MANNKTVSERIAEMGGAQDMREYQNLKVAADMERVSTQQFYERARKETGSDAAARDVLTKKGYDTNLL